MDRCRGLPTVDDLKIPERRYHEAPRLPTGLHRLRSRRDPIVVREEHLRVVLYGVPDALVDVPSSLKEHSHVLLKQTSSPSVVDGGELQSGYHHQIRPVIGPGQMRWERRQGSAEVLIQIDHHLLATSPSTDEAMKPAQVPDAEAHRRPVLLACGAPVDPRTEQTVADEEEPDLRHIAPPLRDQIRQTKRS